MKIRRRTQFDLAQPFFVRRTISIKGARYAAGAELDWKGLGLTERRMFELWRSRFVECGTPDGVAIDLADVTEEKLSDEDLEKRRVEEHRKAQAAARAEREKATEAARRKRATAEGDEAKAKKEAEAKAEKVAAKAAARAEKRKGEAKQAEPTAPPAAPAPSKPKVPLGMS